MRVGARWAQPGRIPGKRWTEGLGKKRDGHERTDQHPDLVDLAVLVDPNDVDAFDCLASAVRPQQNTVVLPAATSAVICSSPKA